MPTFLSPTSSLHLPSFRPFSFQHKTLSLCLSLSIEKMRVLLWVFFYDSLSLLSDPLRFVTLFPKPIESESLSLSVCSSFRFGLFYFWVRSFQIRVESAWIASFFDLYFMSLLKLICDFFLKKKFRNKVFTVLAQFSFRFELVRISCAQNESFFGF